MHMWVIASKVSTYKKNFSAQHLRRHLYGLFELTLTDGSVIKTLFIYLEAKAKESQTDG